MIFVVVIFFFNVAPTGNDAALQHKRGRRLAFFFLNRFPNKTAKTQRPLFQYLRFKVYDAQKKKKFYVSFIEPPDLHASTAPFHPVRRFIYLLGNLF